MRFSPQKFETHDSGLQLCHQCTREASVHARSLQLCHQCISAVAGYAPGALHDKFQRRLQRMREGWAMALGDGAAPGEVRSGGEGWHREPQRMHQRMRKGRRVAAGTGAAMGADGNGPGGGHF